MKSKMNSKRMVGVFLLSLAATLPQPVLADSANCGASGCSAGPLSVSLSVTIPSVLRFQLGAAGSTPAVAFNGSVTAANVGTGAVSADSVTNGGSASNGIDQVYYRLLSNLGGTNVQIGATGVGTLTNGTDTIPYTTIGATTTPSTGGGIVMPVAGAATTVLPTGGLIDEAGTWAYTFSNATVYPAGTYTGAITYTATHTP